MESLEVKAGLVEALQMDLVGPTDTLGDKNEILSQTPSRWYLTGFLVSSEAPESQKSDPTSEDDIDQAAEPGGLDDGDAPETKAAKKSFLTSSIGVSALISSSTNSLEVKVNYGLYKRQDSEEGQPTSRNWQRKPIETTVSITLKEQGKKSIILPDSGGVEVVWSCRDIPDQNELKQLPNGTRSLSVFLVNSRKPEGDDVADEGFIFQAQLDVKSEEGFVPRPDLGGSNAEEWDEDVADLQFRNAYEYAVGHNVSTIAHHIDNECKHISTTWLPTAEVERVAPAKIGGITLEMEKLAELTDAQDAMDMLGGFVSKYKAWIENQLTGVGNLSPKRQEVAEELLRLAGLAADRIEQGIKLLDDKDCLDAFRIANRTMAAQGKRRLALQLNKPAEEIIPAWRPFQLAYILMNLEGVADPTCADRETVDLLFFPTGGGKTEAYLGLAAFTLVLRRLQNPGLASAGLSVLMRYTLRLLTLDQLSRAAALICALELERQQDVEKLGEWPFEIGLWVGLAATPNKLGAKGDGDSYAARSKVIAYQNDDRKPSPIPLEECPWCGEKFKKTSFKLTPNPDRPTNLLVVCANRRCDFNRDNPLPILAVDEAIYRRLPCFLIATVDKFAAMPWTGEVGGFFGRVDRADSEGFYGACEPGDGRKLPVDALPPPDLIIQDELHLISGPLGTMVGLYETALDGLASISDSDGAVPPVRPKIIASTATVKRAVSQVRALFSRRVVEVFPPPGPDIRDSFFARTKSTGESNARQYVGVAAQGRSPKVVQLRVYMALLGAAQKEWLAQGGKKNKDNPVDPYMTLLCYFNSLRELGGTRRLIEDEVRTQLTGRAERKRVGEADGLFANRTIAYEPVELTSRVSTNKVSEAKRRLSQLFHEDDRVDVAIATNMISVGLDITRLGLMVCLGQPKTTAEYIQATSRVGRDVERPGLVVTILNVHRPRDRSHFERFNYFHDTFYRSVEATSVTPFSPRALDRGLAGTLVSLARLGHIPMTPPRGAGEITREKRSLEYVTKVIAERARDTQDQPSSPDARALENRVRDRCKDLFDEWDSIANEQEEIGGALQYHTEVGSAQRLLYEFLNPELKDLPKNRWKFRANRSLRDVEPSVNLWLKNLDGIELDNESDGD